MDYFPEYMAFGIISTEVKISIELFALRHLANKFLDPMSCMV